MQDATTDPEQGRLYETMLFQRSQVFKRIDELADEMVSEYKGKNPLFVCLLRGGAPFASLLMFSITQKDPYFHPELDYMTIRSYGDKLTAQAPGLVMNISPHTQPVNRPAVLLDDVLDTGETAIFAAEQLQKQGSKSIDLCVLVKKQKKQSVLMANFFMALKHQPTG
jgi:hypoxanthine phosphoribosyltransferase